MFRMAYKRTVGLGAAIHECGGARMGDDPATSVLNAYNQVWDAKNVFVTDSSCFASNGTCGPTLTTMALTVRACEYIAKEYGNERRARLSSLARDLGGAMKKRVRAAILGTGFIGRVHLEALCRLGFVEVAALATADHGQADRLAREYGVERVEHDYRRVLDDPDIDVIHVCTPTALHAQMVKDALLAGKHVLSEKPLATSVADAVELVELAKKQGVRNCTNHNLRYYPLVQHMRRMREQGELGEILVVQGQYTQDYLLYDTDWNWRLDSKDSGPSCAMADIGSHFCDMTEHVTGLRITRALRRAEHLPRRSASAPPAGWRASPASCGRESRSTRSMRSTPRTTARCCCASATAPAGASAPGRCSPARRTA